MKDTCFSGPSIFHEIESNFAGKYFSTLSFSSTLILALAFVGGGGGGIDVAVVFPSSP